MNEYIALSYGQVAAATLLIVLNGAISLFLRLKLERSLALAALRMTVQLFLIGFVLQWVFALRRWYLVLAIMLVMTLVAGATAVSRNAHGYRGMFLDSIVSVWASSWLITAIALFAIVNVEPWYRPQYAIPILGMILGNTLTGISLSVERLGEELTAKRDQIDASLALGATRWEAARPAVRAAVQAGMIPIVNAMLVAGVVSLPGMMTGQLLAGVAPIEAVKYQIVIMFLIASGAALGAVGAALLSYRRLFNARHQFCHHLIATRRKKMPT